MWPVLEVFKMAGYFPDSPRTVRAKMASVGIITVMWETRPKIPFKFPTERDIFVSSEMPQTDSGTIKLLV